MIAPLTCCYITLWSISFWLWTPKTHLSSDPSSKFASHPAVYYTYLQCACLQLWSHAIPGRRTQWPLVFFCHPVFMAVYGYWLEWQPATMWGCQLTLYSFCKIVTVTSSLGCWHCLHSNVDCGAGLCNGRASVLSVPLIDSSSGGWRVCSCAPSGQEISIVSCRRRI